MEPRTDPILLKSLATKKVSFLTKHLDWHWLHFFIRVVYFCQGGMGHWIINYTCSQRFINTLPISFAFKSRSVQNLPPLILTCRRGNYVYQDFGVYIKISYYLGTLKFVVLKNKEGGGNCDNINLQPFLPL